MVEKSTRVRTIERFEKKFKEIGEELFIERIDRFLTNLGEFSENPYVPEPELPDTLDRLNRSYGIINRDGLVIVNYLEARGRTEELDEIHRTLGRIDRVYQKVKSKLESYGK